MNAQNAKDYLPLVQALADGKTIQYQDELGDWLDAGTEIWLDRKISDYRIKPQAREWWLVPGVSNALAVDSLASARQYTSDDTQITHVREIVT